jgi:putative ABC transport system substrate-binding protein
MQFGQLKRREFITLLAGATAWPLAARAQRTAMPLIGFLNGQTAAGFVHLTAAFQVGLGEGGFTEGRNVAIEYRWANGDGQRMRMLAEELIGLRVAVLVATGGAHLAAKAATASVPIVCSMGNDPVKLGLRPANPFPDPLRRCHQPEDRKGARPGGAHLDLAARQRGHRVMRRREFITLLGGAGATWPLATRAQQPAKLPTVGYMGSGTPATQGQWAAAFAQRLRELGWIEGRTVEVEHRWAQGRTERAAEIATEFARRNVNVIVTSGTALIVAAKQATSVIPIVFAAAGDPVGTGLVASLARPGGNITGLSLQQTETTGKRLELLREVAPSLRRLAILANVDSAAAVLDMREVQATTNTLGLEVITLEIRRGEDIAAAFEAINGRADALYVVIDPLVGLHRIRINTLALAARLPTMHTFREGVEAGGPMSYGPNFLDLFRRAADYTDKILRGAKPADIPVEQPTKFDLVINLTTAKALGLKIPEAFLLRADELIE